LVFAAVAAAWVAARLGRGWRAVVVFASFLPALVLWAYVLAASVYVALLLLGIAAVD
jgi:Na+/glutamate symporter